MENEIVTSTASPVLVYPDVVPESPWFDFFQGIIGSLAWPAVVVLGIFLFHRQILEMLLDAENIEVPGGFSFKRRMKAVAEKAKEFDQPDAEVAQENNERLARLIDTAAASPTGAIMAAWKDLDAASVELVNLVSTMINIESLPDADFKNVKSLDELVRNKVGVSRYMVRLGLLPPAEAQSFEELRKLRNRAAHEPEGAITVEQARSYVRIADRLTDLIRTNIRNINAGNSNGPHG